MLNFTKDYKISKSVYEKLTDIVPVYNEIGGILGGFGGTISEIVIDCSLQRIDRAEYSPDLPYLSEILEQWNQSGIELYGLFHTHPKGQEHLSQTDKVYIADFFALNDIDELLFPIVIPGEEVYYYLVDKNGIITIVDIEKI